MRIVASVVQHVADHEGSVTTRNQSDRPGGKSRRAMDARVTDNGRLPGRRRTEGVVHAPRGIRFEAAGLAQRALPFLAAVLVSGLLGVGAGHALDAAPRPQPITPALAAPVIKYGSVREALQSGMR